MYQFHKVGVWFMSSRQTCKNMFLSDMIIFSSKNVRVSHFKFNSHLIIEHLQYVRPSGASAKKKTKKYNGVMA